MDEDQIIRSLPPLKPLRAFALVALTKSFTTAGKQMYLSQSAVSSQVKQLEEYLDVQLFERKPNRLSLTEAGKRYAELVTQALNMLSSATVEVMQYQKCIELKLQTPLVFSVWLHARLDRFVQQHPHIKLHFQSLKNLLFLGDSVDIAIMHRHWGEPQSCPDQLAKEHFCLALADESDCEQSDWCLIYQQEHASEKAIKAFANWLQQETRLFPFP